MSHGIGKDINNPNIYVSSELTGKINLDIRDVFLPSAKDKRFYCYVFGCNRGYI